MNIYCNSDGSIFHIDPERVYQGSAGVNTIRFIGRFPSSAQVLVSYKLPRGILTTPSLMTFVDEIEQITEPQNGGMYSVWETTLGAVPKINANGDIIKGENGEVVYDLDYTITEHYGTVEMRFYVYPASHSITVDDAIYNANAELATARTFFQIERGDPALLPTVEELTAGNARILLAQILNGIASTKNVIDNNLQDLRDEVADNVNADEVREIITEMVENGDISGGGGVVEETDPTVPSWAKQPNKPTYTYSEITEKPTLLVVGETSGTAYDGAKGKQNATDIATLKERVAGKQDAIAFDGTYNANTNKAATVKTVTDKIAAVIAGADTSYDTLKEISDWILAHPNDVAALNAAITSNANAIAALQNGKQDKLTAADKNALIQDVISALPIYDGSVTDV